MKIATIIVRVLLGLVFAVFGLDAFIHFIPAQPLPKGEAGAFLGALYSTEYLHAIKSFEVVGGLILLIGKRVPLGLTLLGPVIVNILFYDVFLDRTGLVMGIVVAALELFLVWRYRHAFVGLLKD